MQTRNASAITQVNPTNLSLPAQPRQRGAGRKVSTSLEVLLSARVKSEHAPRNRLWV